MITNNLLMKFKNREKENIEKAKHVLLGMSGKISELQDIRVELDIRHGATSYDLIMFAEYNSMEDFEAYIIHPIHLEVVNYLKEHLDSSVSVCYES